MPPKKYDSFQPRRATNIDGFLTSPAAHRPRRPAFRAGTQQPVRSVRPQRPSGRLQDMPQRRNRLSPASESIIAQSPVALGGEANQPRRRSRLEPQPRQRGKGKPAAEPLPRRAKIKRIFKRSGQVLGALILLAVIVLGARFYKDIARITGNANPLSLLSVFHPAHLKNQDGRVNILVAGNSADDPGHNGGNLTDSIMVLSVNTRDNTALMLSIPRDLWIDLPGSGHSKINAAYDDGGMSELQEVVEDSLGVPIDYNVLVDYGAFRDLVDAVGGITITIKSDDPRGIYDPSLDYTTRSCCALAKYPNGSVRLNGKQALNLARARGDAYGSYGFPEADFDRTMHQRQMLLAIKDKATSAGVIANPLKVSNLVDAVGKNVKTNLQLNEIETLYTYMKKVNDNDIGSYNLNTLAGNGTTMLKNYTSPNGQSALIPAAGLDDFSDIQGQLTRLLSNDPIAKESPSVVVLNATDTTGLAARYGTRLTSKGFDVPIESNAPTAQTTTTIIDNTGGKKPKSLSYLKSTYRASAATNASLSANYPNADFILILGQNMASSSSNSTSSR